MSYDGGKAGAGVFQWIINHIPPHDIYAEPFLGDGAVLRAKRPARYSYGVEINPVVIAERWQGCDIPGLTVIHGDAISFLRVYDWLGDEFVYIDPPYLMQTRSCQRQLYEFEFAEAEQHVKLLRLLKEMPCRVAISGYYSQLYTRELAGWRTSTFQTVKRSGELAVEWLWMNYPPPMELHDYRYLGRNFRERERIKRKKTRWTQRLRSMPDLERYALLEAIQEVRSERSTIAGNGEGAGVLDHLATNDGADDQASSLATTMGAPTGRYDDGSWPASPVPTIPAGIATNDDAGAEGAT